MNDKTATSPALDWLPVICAQALSGACSTLDVSRFVFRASTELEARHQESAESSLHWEHMAVEASGERRVMLETCIRLRLEELRQYAQSLELLRDYAASHRGVHAELALLAAESAQRARRGWLAEMRMLVALGVSVEATRRQRHLREAKKERLGGSGAAASPHGNGCSAPVAADWAGPSTDGLLAPAFSTALRRVVSSPCGR